MSDIKKVALFGGTFNPIHNGHLLGAKHASQIVALDRVYFIPSRIPPHRDVEQGTPASDRFEMVRLACKADPLFEPSDFEINRPEKSYTLVTAMHFKKILPHQTSLFFLIGTDAFSEIDTWYKIDDLFVLTDFLVMARPGFVKDLTKVLPETLRDQFTSLNQNQLRHRGGHSITLIEIDGLDISSTQIRRRIADGQDVQDFVPAAVADYIYTNELYTGTRTKKPPRLE